MDVRRALWWSFMGKPSGPLGELGARLMASVNGDTYRQVAVELGLQPDDDLLDVGCGSASLLVDQAAGVRHVAGLEASGIQIGKARSRLAERLAAGSAELVTGDMGSLPWEDGRFSAVSAVNVLKFAPDPLGALREMARVLRSGGRLVITIDDFSRQSWGGAERSGGVDAFGQWQWGESDIQRLLEDAGFGDVRGRALPGKLGLELVRGTKP
jgi:SAM-dependent methyltransferase